MVVLDGGELGLAAVSIATVISALAIVAVPAIVVMVAVVLAVPVAFVHAPAVFVMVIVRVCPIGALIGRAVIASGDPHITVAPDSPVTVLPNESRAGRWRAALVAHRRRRLSDGYAEADLG